MIDLIEQTGVDSRNLLHAEVDLVEPVLQAVQQKFGNAACHGRGVRGFSQFGQVQPLAAQTLLCAKADVVGQWTEPADQIHVRHSERSGVVVLLPDAQERSEFRSDAGFLEDLTHSCGT